MGPAPATVAEAWQRAAANGRRGDPLDRARRASGSACAATRGSRHRWSTTSNRRRSCSAAARRSRTACRRVADRRHPPVHPLRLRPRPRARRRPVGLRGAGGVGPGPRHRRRGPPRCPRRRRGRAADRRRRQRARRRLPAAPPRAVGGRRHPRVAALRVPARHRAGGMALPGPQPHHRRARRCGGGRRVGRRRWLDVHRRGGARPRPAGPGGPGLGAIGAPRPAPTGCWPRGPAWPATPTTCWPPSGSPSARPPRRVAAGARAGRAGGRGAAVAPGRAGHARVAAPPRRASPSARCRWRSPRSRPPAASAATVSGSSARSPSDDASAVLLCPF